MKVDVHRNVPGNILNSPQKYMKRLVHKGSIVTRLQEPTPATREPE